MTERENDEEHRFKPEWKLIGSKKAGKKVIGREYYD